MPRVSPQVLKNVVFLQYEVGGDLTFAGSAFLIEHPLEPIDWTADAPPMRAFTRTGPSVTYLVTAFHVIHQIQTKMGDSDIDIILRINDRKGGLVADRVAASKWTALSSPPFRDVAILQWNPEPVHDLFAYDIEGAAVESRRRASGAEISEGTDLFMPGLFSKREGKDRNIPIVRQGTLAALADWNEPIEVEPYGNTIVHLAEMRSIGGLSGSPVFASVAGLAPSATPARQSVVDPDTGRVILRHTVVRGGESGVQIGDWVIRGSHEFYLLGVNSGHFNADIEDKGLTAALVEKVNTGIGFITPVEAILEALDVPKHKKERDDKKKEVDNGAVS